jgi:hypothetical protein
VKATPGSGYTWLYDDFTIAGHDSWAAPVQLIFDHMGSPAGTLNDTMILRNGVIKDTTTYGSLYGGFVFQSDRFEAENVRFDNNNHNTVSTEGGALRIAASTSSKLSNCAFEYNRAGFGAAVYLTGSAMRHEIWHSTFQRNIAMVQGGAINWQTAGPFELLIESSVFTSNQVTLGDTAAFSDLTFRIHTAGAGVGGGASSNDRALEGNSAVMPVWFIGPSVGPFSEHLPMAHDGSVESMRAALSGPNTCTLGACPDGTECQCPAGTTCTTDADFECGEFIMHGHREYGSHFYSTQRTYAEVVRLRQGPHRLWHGSVISTADTYHTNWDGVSHT